MARFVLFLSLFLSLKPGLACAQEQLRPRPNTTLVDVQPGERNVPEAFKLAVFRPKYVAVDAAAEVIRQLMGKSVTVVVEPAANRMLIRGTEQQIQQASKVLETLDNAPKLIAIEVVFADLPAAAEGKESKPTGGTADEEWLERLKNQNDKTKGNIQKIRLTAVENQQAMVQYGEQTPVVAGVQRGFGGGRGGAGAVTRTPVVRQEQTGTIVQCTARVSQDETIIAELSIERSRFAPPEKSAVLDESDEEGTLSTPGQLTTTCKTTLTLKPGKPRVIAGRKSAGATRGTQSVIVITAELISPNE